MKRITGTGVALVTPFKEDKSIDYEALERLIEFQINNGTDYLVVMGTTGENATLSKSEQRSIVEFCLKVNNKRLPVVVGIGGNNTQDLVANINFYDFEGIDAILTVTPYYNRPAQEGLYQHYAAVSEASPVPVILYNVPSRTGCNLSAATTLRLAHDFDNIVAIKEASSNFDQIGAIIKDAPADFIVISGDDATTLPLISMGAKGAISVVSNVAPKITSDLVRYAMAGDFEIARPLHYKLIDLVNGLFAEGSPAGPKAVLDAMDICRQHVRLPLVPVSDAHYKKLKSLIESI